MTYNVDQARAERAAERSSQPFAFQVGDDVWTMKHPDDLPMRWYAWSMADYARRFADLVVEPGFPDDALTTGDMNAIVKAWLGSTPGE